MPASAALRSRNVRLAIFAHAISTFGDRMTVVALAFAVLSVGGGASAVGLVLACESLPMVASVLAGGVVGDRLPRRAVMVAADLVRLVTQGAAGALLLTGVAEVWMLAALAAAGGLASGFFNPAATGLVPMLVDPAEVQSVNALRASAVSIGEIVAPALAGVLVAAVNPGTAFAVDAATFACSALALAALRIPAHVPAAVATSFIADLRDGWTAFRSRRWVWSFVAYFSFGNLMWAAWAGLGPVVAARNFGGAGPWGFVFAAMGVGTLVGGLLATRIDPRRPLLVVALVEGLFGLPLALLASGAPAVIVAVATFLSGVGLMIGMSVWESTLQRQVPADAISRVSSYDWFGSYAFYPLGLAVWGPIAVGVGIHTALWVAFGLMAAAIATLVALPDTRTLEYRPGDDVTWDGTPVAATSDRPATTPRPDAARPDAAR